MPRGFAQKVGQGLKKGSEPCLLNREAFELNSRGQRPRKAYRNPVPTLKGSKNRD
jgi:hypothetical protein